MKPVACMVLPTYNEAQNLRVLLPMLFEQEKQVSSHQLHVLVVDDHSPDGTELVVQEFRRQFPYLHIIHGEKKGLGEAYKRGIAHAIAILRPELILHMDADLQHDPSLVPHMIRACNEGYTLVIGSRYVRGGQMLNFSWRRTLLSQIGNFMVRWAGNLKIHDCTSGYRAIRTDLLVKCDVEHFSARGYSFLAAFLCQLVWNGARVLEIPITFGVRSHGESKLSLRDQAEFLGRVVRIFLGRLTRRVAVVQGAENLS